MLKKHLQIAVFCMVSVVAVAAQAAKPAGYDPASYSEYIAKITAGANSEERGAAIKAELAKLGIRVSSEGFIHNGKTPREIKGTNIIAEISNPKAKRTVMIGAHYDRVAVGTGAVDNASGVAVVLELLKAFKARPLANINLQAAFWDQEERGLVGSRVYVENRAKGGLPNVYINFDVFGYGDALWLWTADENLEFAKNFAAVAGKSPGSFTISTEYPPSDHRSFAVPGVESYSFSLASKDEIANILKVLRGEKVEPANFPKVLQTIHTANDTADKIDANVVTRALPVVEEAIRTLDK